MKNLKNCIALFVLFIIFCSSCNQKKIYNKNGRLGDYAYRLTSKTDTAYILVSGTPDGDTLYIKDNGLNKLLDGLKIMNKNPVIVLTDSLPYGLIGVNSVE